MRAGVSHLRRAKLTRHHPVHVTLRIADGLPTLRDRKLLPVLDECFARAREKPGFRIAHYGVMGNHVHLIVEGDDREALVRGMQGLCIRMAKALNRWWGRTGAVFADRYHDRILKSPREVRNALVYVLRNAKKHVRRGTRQVVPSIDSFTSAHWFDGWKECGRKRFGLGGLRTVAEAKSWLLTTGWRRYGLIAFGERPAG